MEYYSLRPVFTVFKKHIFAIPKKKLIPGLLFLLRTLSGIWGGQKMGCGACGPHKEPKFYIVRFILEPHKTML